MGSGWFRLWLRNRWRGIGAGVVLLLALGIVVFVVTNGSGVSLTLLGDAAAARPTDMSGIGALPQDGAAHNAPSAAPDAYASVLDTPAPASAGPQSVAEAQAHWSAAEIARHQQEILAAYNCARTQHGLPSATLDAALSETAAAAWLRLAHDHAFSLMDLSGAYAARSLLALDFTLPDTAAPAAELGGTTDVGAAGCAVGGFDAATLPMAQRALTVGIAVFPPQAGWDGASAVVLVKE